MYPADLKYSSEHEWVRVDGEVARIGITDYAQDALGDVVYVTLPEVGATVTAGEPCGEVESTKSVSDVFAPVTGTVTARNERLNESPDLVNTDPYGEGWLFEVRIQDSAEVGNLLDADAYQAGLPAA
jgi:glycine cleavage system H protein